MTPREKAVEAARKILGETTFDALVIRISTPRLLNMAAVAAFTYEMEGDHIGDLREGLKRLEECGKL